MPEKFLQNIIPREYQNKIFKTCSEKNCLVVLPTGLGKTLIALMLTIRRMREFPEEKILFLAPTKPLVQQHLISFKKYLPELFGDMQLFTGKINSTQRKKIWQTADIIFSTPQCIANDLKQNLYNLKDVSLLIEDEAHRCIKNYDYNYVAQQYKKQAINQRILGLTASPGNDTFTIKDICKNLSIQEVELRTRDSEDVKKYLQELEFEKIVLEFPPELEEIRHVLLKLYNQYVEELKIRRVLFKPASKINLINLQKELMASLARGNKNYNYLLGVSACAQAVKIQHALELLETQTLESFNKYLKKLFSQAAKKQSKGVVKLVAKQEFNFIYMQSNELLAKNFEHPKLKKIIEIIKKEQNKNKKLRIIVFTQFRDTATIISKKLNELNNIKAKVFIGQAKKEGIGLNQKQQKKIIQEFSDGEINVLCATSLHPDEYIVLKHKNKITIKKIGEFVNSFLKEKENTKKITDWQALSTNRGKTLFKPITYVHKHKAKNNLINIKLKSGFECSMTKDHELFTFNQNEKFIKTKPELNKFIALPIRSENITQNTKIDVMQELYENCSEQELNNFFGSLQGLNQAKIRILKTNLKVISQLENKNLSITELANLIKRDYSTIKTCLKRLSKEDLIIQKRIKKNYKNISQITKKGQEYLNYLRWFFQNVKYSKGKYRFKISTKNSKKFQKFFNQSININYGKVKFPRFINLNTHLARFLGFYVSEGSTRKTQNTSDIFLAARKKEMQKLMKKSIEKGLLLKARTNWRGIAIDSQIAHHLIKNVFKAGIGSYNKEVPEIIFTAPTNIKWEFLKAYFLGDGYLGKDKIVLTTVSKKLIIGLILLLRTLKIEKISLYKQKQTYRLNISESLPFAKIKEKNDKKGKAYYSLIPTALNSKKIFEKHENFFSKNNNTRKNGKWENDICFDYIKKITKIEKPNFVYDITVKDTKNFIGGTGLFCLHNCIAEEGLDIPEVNAVIFYEPIPSAIRAIQRTGRTARLMKGKLIILITKNTRDETFYYVSRAREKKMHSSINTIKEEFKNHKLEFQKKLE